jgi:hypothetical protein
VVKLRLHSAAAASRRPALRLAQRCAIFFARRALRRGALGATPQFHRGLLVELLLRIDDGNEHRRVGLIFGCAGLLATAHCRPLLLLLLPLDD